MDYTPIYMAPQTTPGLLTLQASRATWTALAAILEVREAGSFRRSPRVSTTVRGALTGEDDRAVRVTLPEDQARAVLRLAGVSA